MGYGDLKMKMRIAIFAIAISAPNIFGMLKSESEDSMSSFPELPLSRPNSAQEKKELPASISNSSTSLVQPAQVTKKRCCCVFLERIFESLANTPPTPFNPPVYSINSTERKTKLAAQSSAPLD